MATPAPAPVRTGRDPAVVVWGVAGACWTVTVGFLLAGAPVSCHGATGPAGTLALPAVFAAWLVMAGAMMLPTVVPLVRLFVPVTARVPNPVVARVAFFGGYLAVWSGFAAAAMLGDRAVAALVGSRPGPVAAADLVLGATLVAAGLFQFSRLKRACLTACRSPWAFLWQHYRRGSRGGWTLGVRHGVLCLGCCWALMLVMFGAGVGSLLWMLALTGFMIVEKTAPHGARLVAPLGGALLLAGVAVLAVSATSGGAPGAPARSGGDVGPGTVALLVAAVGLAVLWPGRAPRGGRVGSDARPRRRAGQGGSDDGDR